MTRLRLNDDPLERELRRARATAPPDLVAAISARTRAERPARPRLRLGLAGAVSFAALLAFASIGGLGQAAAAAKKAAAAVAQATTPPGQAKKAPAPTATPTASLARGAEQPAVAAAGGGKVTICHATGSNSNPYVEVTVSQNAAANGHARHGGDIIPAPPGGCPGPVPSNDQYKPGKGCGDKNHVHFREGQCKGGAAKR